MNQAQVLFSKIKLPPLLPAISLAVLLICLTRVAQEIFYNLHTSPAIIWSPAGISLAFVLIYGYRMWIPIFLASLFASFFNPTSPPFIIMFVGAIASTVQPILGVYLLRKIGFNNTFSNTGNVLKFFGLVVVISAIAPLIITPTQALMGTMTDTFFVTFTRSWTGRLLSILAMTPLIVTWWPWKKITATFKEGTETALAFGLLLVSIYFTFWSNILLSYSFLLLVALFTSLFWVSLRLSERAMFLSIFLLTVLGMAGSIFNTEALKPLNERLFGTELFIILIAPIFFTFSSLLNERRITIKKLEENMDDLKSALHKLDNDDRSKNEFIAILAHELRNPLAPLMSTLELLKLQKQTPDAIQMISAAENQLQSMKRLLEDLLDVARVVQKKFKLQKQEVDLHNAINHCVYSTEAIMQSHRHTLAIVSMPKQKVILNVDPVRFEQIIVNLLNNAAKYTEPEGWVGLSCAVIDGKLEIKVEDNGIGIAPENIRNIFQPFHQIRPKPHVGTGLGLGLSLVKRLVEMHEGEVSVSSPGIGKGSIFTVTFPLSAQSVLPLKKPETKSKKILTKKVKNEYDEKFKVLVVDDNEPAAQGLGRLLGIKGHEISLAYGGIEAIKIASEFGPQIILLDIGLPDIDGYEVARKLRRSNYSGTLIALTGFGQDEDKLRAVNAGFNHHLTKPVGLAELENVLYRHA